MNNSRFSLHELPGTLLAILVLGVMMGGVYAVPAMYFTKRRDPSYTILLAAGLSTTVIGLGTLFGISQVAIVLAWVFAVGALALRRRAGPLDQNLERFGMVHALTLIGMGWIVLGYRLLA